MKIFPNYIFIFNPFSSLFFPDLSNKIPFNLILEGDRKFCWGESLVVGFFVLLKFSKRPPK